MANRAMAAKVDRAKRQATAAVQGEMSKACYLKSKPAVPAYDHAMVKRVEVPKKERKTRYVSAKPAPLVRTGLGTIGSWDDVGTCRLIKRH